MADRSREAMSKPCKLCRKRPARSISRRRWSRHGWNAKRHHEVCQRCWRGILERAVQEQKAEKGVDTGAVNG